MRRYRLFFLCSILGIFSVDSISYAQETIVSGKVIDSNSGDPIPFANVVFTNTNIGVTTDFEGNFILKTNTRVDSLSVSYIGYKKRTKQILPGRKQIVNFQLVEDVINLQEVVVIAGENPAWEILRKVIKSKPQNDKRKLTAYEYDTYTKVEIDVDNVSDKLREKKIMQKISQVLDSVDRIAGEDGKPILPLFISESVSKIYYRDNPSLKKELILKTKIKGLGVEDGTLIAQIIGSSFQEYNFYQNWLNIVSKEFVSPIADGWRVYYEYDLIDSVFIGDHFCYRLDFFPKSQQDLAFYGTVWITKNEFAIKQIDVTVSKSANLNFIEKIKIQQELEPTELGPWLPIKNRILVDAGELTKASAGMLAKFYTSNKNFAINMPYNSKFYERSIEMDEEARLYEDEKYWDTLRHEPLSETEKNVIRMIDTLQNIPVVKTYIDIIKIAVNGYLKAGPLDVGPYIYTVALNDIEGFRLQGGFKTNFKFSNRWVIGGQLGYGFDDEEFKYSYFVRSILSRKNWTTLTFRVRRDIARIGIEDEQLDNALFSTALRWGTIRRGYYFEEYHLNFERQFFRGYSQRIAFRTWSFDPTYSYGYYSDPGDITSPIRDSYRSSEVIVESRYARDEYFLQNDNDRISLGTIKWPVISFRYTHGFKGAFGSDFEYDKIRAGISKRIKFGVFGVAYANLSGEYIFNTLPYPLLALHLGNQTPVLASQTFNLMNFGEFVSDRYVSLQYRHYLEGFFLNRIPLIKRLNWRILATGNFIYGGLRQSNRDINAPLNPDGVPTLSYGYFTNKPYVELGYGVENIFRFLRVDFIHRISYLDNPDARKFGILFSVFFQL